ncbi:hypothetical protein BT63DRAFT_459512 [Microthyrium microscopicum]|uniref:Uncharacterized protein n=1 Tax=Microthyrium microscopicum TaxID=703497 RepID=A0A6A6TXT6_9PEZI|nr:hypothetical protein BT63DRAFT_459512 [Microthyrium microscopicum]
MRRNILLAAVAIGVQSAFASPTLHRREPQHGGHGGQPQDAKSPGGGEMGGMGGMGGMTSGMSGGLIDYMLQSEATPALLQMSIGYMEKTRLAKTMAAEATMKRPGVKRMQLWYGPFDVVTAADRKKTPNSNLQGMDPAGTTFATQAENFPGDMTVLKGSVSLVYEDGSPADVNTGVYNHHVVFADTAKRPVALVSCPNQKAKFTLPISVFLAVGEDGGKYLYAQDDPTFDGGYYVAKGDIMYLTAELVNYTNEKKLVYAKVDFEYLPGKGKLEVTSENLSVTNCDGSIGIRPEKGQKKFSVASKGMTFQRDGYMFGIRGHLHDGGVSIPVMINNKTVCESKASYMDKSDAKGTWAALNKMSTCDELIPVKKGDVLSLAANYDLDAHPARTSGGGEAEEMGLIAFSMALKPDPAADAAAAKAKSGGLLGMLGLGR